MGKTFPQFLARPCVIRCPSSRKVGRPATPICFHVDCRPDAVPLDPLLLEMSIRDNLDLEGNHTDAEIWDALEQTSVSGKITYLNLPSRPHPNCDPVQGVHRSVAP